MSKHTPGELTKIATELSRTTNISPAEAFQMVAKECQMAEELERAKDLIAIYERDRTNHLRLIECADTDLAELGESLGEEIEALKAERELRVNELMEQREELRAEVAGLVSHRYELDDARAKAEAQRDELREKLGEIDAIEGPMMADDDYQEGCVDGFREALEIVKAISRPAIAKATP